MQATTAKLRRMHQRAMAPRRAALPSSAPAAMPNSSGSSKQTAMSSAMASTGMAKSAPHQVAGEQPQDQRRRRHAGQGDHRGEGDRQRDAALGEVGDDVRHRAARHRRHQDQAEGDAGLRRQRRVERQRHQRRADHLHQGADEEGARLAEDADEVGEAQASRPCRAWPAPAGRRRTTTRGGRRARTCAGGAGRRSRFRRGRGPSRTISTSTVRASAGCAPRAGS